jgi:uncharacterized protein (TIGR02646 family)
MIQLKERPTPPKTLNLKKVKDFKAELEKRVANGEHIKSKDFRTYWSEDDVKDALYDMHHQGKCCYCERRRDERREPDVEHFRPKAKVEGTDHPGYWWLAYCWDNYFFSCKKCNQEHKKNQFPLMDGGQRAYTKEDNLEEENPFLINPEKENPEDFVGFEWQRAYGILVIAVGIDAEGRGNETIRITGINLGKIPEERAELVRDLKRTAETMTIAKYQGSQVLIDEVVKEIQFHTRSERIFAGFRRAFFRAQGLGEYVSTD